MDTCQARRGFLILHDCGAPSTSTCDTCNRPMCSEHMSSRSGYKTCLDCYSKTYQLEKNARYDDEWAYTYRRHYYTTYGYSPWYDGGYDFDDYDVRSFDDNVNAVGDSDDVERAGFGDS